MGFMFWSDGTLSNYSWAWVLHTSKHLCLLGKILWTFWSWCQILWNHLLQTSVCLLFKAKLCIVLNVDSNGKVELFCLILLEIVLGQVNILNTSMKKGTGAFHVLAVRQRMMDKQMFCATEVMCFCLFCHGLVENCLFSTRLCWQEA